MPDREAEETPDGRVSRHLHVVVVGLATGALINLVVAWIIAYRVHIPDSSRLEYQVVQRNGTEVFGVRAFRDAGATWVWSVRLRYMPWHPMYATGPPDTPKSGDLLTAWASLGQDDQDEWLEVEYEQAIDATEIRVYETYGTGALRRIVGIDTNGNREQLWRGVDPTPVGSGIGISRIGVDPSRPVKRLQLEIASTSVKSWNEIDAVGVVDADGREYWAVNATASSTYVTQLENQGVSGLAAVPGGWSHYEARVAAGQIQAAPAPNWAKTDRPLRDGNDYRYMLQIASGWPLRSFRAKHDLSVHDGTSLRVSGGIPMNENVSLQIPVVRALPFRPIWLGFIGNTLLYASLIWGYIAAKQSILCRRRRRTGCCPACAYDLRGANHISCPECGRETQKEYYP